MSVNLNNRSDLGNRSILHPNRSAVVPTASLCGRRGAVGVELEEISPNYFPV